MRTGSGNFYCCFLRGLSPTLLVGARFKRGNPAKRGREAWRAGRVDKTHGLPHAGLTDQCVGLAVLTGVPEPESIAEETGRVVRIPGRSL